MPKKVKSLNRKLVVYVLTASICFAVITSVASFLVESERSLVKTELMINQLLDTVEYSAAIAAYTNNRQIAEEVAQGLLRNDIVHQATITGDQGLKIEQERKSLSDLKRTITRKLISPFDKNQVIGLIEVRPENDSILSEARHSALLSIVNSFLVIAMTTVILLLIARNIILNPLTHVSNALHAIGSGKRERIAGLKKNQNDELGRLVEDINSLLAVLESKLENERALRGKIQDIEKQLRNIFETTSAGLFLLDKDAKVLTYNPTLLKIMGKTLSATDEIGGKDFAQLFFQNPDEVGAMITSVKEQSQFESRDLLLHSTDMEQKWVHCIMSKIYDANGQLCFEGVVFDVSSRLAEEKAIRYQAEFDSLTKLLRRDSVERKLTGILQDVSYYPVVVMLLDLDGFKAVNDTYGHDAGDEVLVEVAQRFLKNVRSDDIVARLGGDEFLIILKKCEPVNVELVIAEKVIRAIQCPITLKSNITVNIGVSIGMATNALHGKDLDMLMKAADDAMYKVKQHGKNGFSVRNNDGEYDLKLFPPK